MRPETELERWEQRYRAMAANSGEAAPQGPSPFLSRACAEFEIHRTRGRALDLACGVSRDALWLAAQGWYVTAVDGSPTAISLLKNSASQQNLTVNTAVADLECGEYRIEPDAWDMILVAKYFQRSLIPSILTGARPGGWVLMSALLRETNGESVEQSSRFRLQTGELRAIFLTECASPASGHWTIRSYVESVAKDSSHGIAELVAQRDTIEEAPA